MSYCHYYLCIYGHMSFSFFYFRQHHFISAYNWRIVIIHSHSCCQRSFKFSYYSIITLCNRVFFNRPGDRGSIPGRVIQKTQKMVLDAALLNTQHYKISIKGKWSNPENGVAPSPSARCKSYWKGNVWVTLDWGHALWYISKNIIYASIAHRILLFH